MSENKYGSSISTELELKFDVEHSHVLPQDFIVSGFFVCNDETFDLVTTYYDTVKGDLAQTRAALRHRTGGADAGWHVKIKAEQNYPNIEYFWEDDKRNSLPPLGALELLTERVGYRLTSVNKIATLESERRQLTLCDENRRPVALLVDDHVSASNHLKPAEKYSTKIWREWELELVQGAHPEELQKIVPALLAAGAVPSKSTSKIGRAMQ